ncbi:MAG: MBOAT family protein [Treponema sp.]|nr:MBOAT family protein [Treponema sp.]
MNILSMEFFILLAVTFVLYYVLPKKFQWICLLVASFVFYFFTGTFNFVFILISSVTTFFAAKKLSLLNGKFIELKKSGNYAKEELKNLKLQFRTKKRIVLFATLIINFGILAALKYWNTIITMVADSASKDLSFLILGRGKGLLLPLGISFYTFQAVGYLLDVYNSKIKDETNFAKYLLFLSFFPQLIQGPINRYDKLGTQFSQEHSFDFDNVKEGVLQFLFGAVKKYALADLICQYVSQIFDSTYNDLPGSMILFGILLYSFYQYADFSGGIDMVLGVAKLFGIKMQPNFKQPYFSISLADFWRRWHISLGLWMKDYVFYPFVLTEGMQKFTKKCTKISKHLGRAIPAGIANILVFFIVGIWHGPEMHYVLWGLYNGLVIAISDLLKPCFAKITEKLHLNTKSLGFKIFQIIRTFIIVNIGWYFDRIYDVKKSFVFLGNTFTKFKLGQFSPAFNMLFSSMHFHKSRLGLSIVVISIIFITSLISENKGDVYEWYKKRNIVVRWGILYLFLILFIVSLSIPSVGSGFMYANY